MINELDTIGMALLGPFFFNRDKDFSWRGFESAWGHEAAAMEPAIKKIPKYSKARFEKMFEFFSTLLEVLVFSSYKCHLTNVTHIGAITQSNRELEEAHAKLQTSFERLKEIDRMKSNFLAVVSHELRTPLTSVIGYSEMLLEGIGGTLNSNQREYVQVIMEKGEQLLNLIREILNLTKIEAGQMNLALQRQNPADLFKDAVEAIRPLAQKKNISLSLDLAKNIPSPIPLDREKILHILGNLLNNSVKFTEVGGKITVQVSVLSTEDGQAAKSTEGGALVICVEDNGIGISAEYQERIFEKFFQVDDSSTRAFGGTGLGLAIARSLVQIQGGKIWFESRLKQGSKFFFTIPILSHGPE
jgi:signal transduction histidine kinase